MEQDTALRVILELTDESRIIGKTDLEKLPFHTAIGDMKIPLKKIAIIEFAGEQKPATVRFLNGDLLRGQFGFDELDVETLFGKVSIPRRYLKSMRIINGEPFALNREKLLGYWPLEGNARDASGNGHDGTVDGAVLTDTASGPVYRFNGNGGINLGNLDFFSNAFTVSGWILAEPPATQEDWRMWIGKLHPDDGGPFELCLGDGRDSGGGKGPGWMAWDAGTGVLSLNASANPKFHELNLRDGKWHMVTATHEEGSQKLYSDGELVVTGNYCGRLPSNSTDLIIGGMSFGPYHHPWIGRIREVLIYRRILSESEIHEMHLGQSAKFKE